MSLFDWMFEGAVELPVRKWPEGLERSLGEIRDEIARAKAAAEVPRRFVFWYNHDMSSILIIEGASYLVGRDHDPKLEGYIN